MRQFIVLVGNNGTGKTYYSQNHFSKDYQIVRPDDFSGNKEQIHKKIITEIESGLKNNQTIVLDGLNLQKSFRKQLLYFLNRFPDYKKKIIDFGSGNQKTLQRLIADRPYKSESEWTKIHEINYKSYEKPTLDEGYDEIIHIENNFA